jgi:hypothetical protein
VAEEKDETTFIDELYLIAEGIEVRAEANPDIAARVAEKDQANCLPSIPFIVLYSGCGCH